MTRSFPTVYERILRARLHRDAMREMWNGFLSEDDPYDIGIHVADDGKGELWVRPTRALPPALGLELGEMLYQLRAALDACIYQAAVYETGADPPPGGNSLEFPICTSVESFEKSSWKFRPLTNHRTRDFIRQVQPCFISDLQSPEATWVPETLRLLNDWARLDRHRRLHVVGAWSSEADPQFKLPDGVTVASVAVVGFGVLVDDKSQLATFVLDGWEPGMEIHANPNVFITITSDEDPPPKDSSDTFSQRTERMPAAVDLVRKAFEQAY